MYACRLALVVAADGHPNERDLTQEARLKLSPGLQLWARVCPRPMSLPIRGLPAGGRRERGADRPGPGLMMMGIVVAVKAQDLQEESDEITAERCAESVEGAEAAG